MKRLISILLAAILSGFPVQSAEVELYNADGGKIVVQSDDVEKFRAEGWRYFDEAHTVVYSEDGRRADALTSRLDEWKQVGWYDSLSDVQTTLYSEDGRELTVWNAEVDAYRAVGWYRSLSDVQTTLYSEDGRELTVWNAEVDAYRAVGWYRSLSEVQTTLYSEDGRELTVWNAEVEAYLLVGWYRNPPQSKDRPTVALTFDDGPGPYTDRILSCLEKYGAKATFFVVGNRLERYSSVLKREAELGMEIGCHTWSHANLTSLDAAEIANQIAETNKKVQSIVGVYPTVMRPTYGSYNAAVKAAVNSPLIMWSLDTLDWKTRNAESTYNSVIGKVRDGDIILMHDIHEPTAAAVERIVPKLIEQGFELVTVSELGTRKGGLKSGTVYSRVTK